MGIDISIASEADLSFIDHLQRKNAEELAFYPMSAFERELNKGRIILAKVNGQHAGYLYHGALGPKLKIHQACIEYDLRGQLYGARLVNFLERLCLDAGVMSITLRCGSDIDANKFWSAMGFYCESVTDGGVRRMRDINAWRKDISAPLFATEVLPSTKAQDASFWRKGKDGGKSQFLRGMGLKQYREEVLRRAEEAERG